MLNQLSPAYLLPEGNWFNLSYDSIITVGTSSMNRNPGMNSVVLPAPNLKVEQVILTVLTRITVHTYRDNTIPCNGKVIAGWTPSTNQLTLPFME